jgi:hypothetical protein
MLSRRRFCAAVCCGAAAGLLACNGSSASAVSRFVCSTKDTANVNDDSFHILDYSAHREEVELRQQAISTFNFSPYGVSFLNDRWRWSDGLAPNSGKVVLGVAFIGNATQHKSQIQTAAVQWLIDNLGKKIGFDFDVSISKSQIRIACDPGGGNHSEVGRSCLKIPAGKPTMNLDDVTQQVIMHEFGHALGLQHEHQSPDPQNPVIWKNGGQVVIEEMRKQGWSENYTRENILNRLPKAAACIGDPHFNPGSIMVYPIPADWTANGFSLNQNNSISDRDRNCARGMYEA